MIELYVEDEWVRGAHARADRDARQGAKSHQYGHRERIAVGTAGELALVDWLPGAESMETFGHDVLWRGRRIEVKTVSTKVKPSVRYETAINGSRPGQENRQECDVYVFARVIRKERRLWLCCWEFPEVWWGRANRIERGQPIYPGGPTCELAEGMWTQPIYQCKSMESLQTHPFFQEDREEATQRTLF
jgi:hypothetical protein